MAEAQLKMGASVSLRNSRLPLNHTLERYGGHFPSSDRGHPNIAHPPRP